MIFKEQLESEIKEQNKILNEELKIIKNDLKELQQKYLNLRCRYSKQNNELIKLEIELNKRRNNDNSRS